MCFIFKCVDLFFFGGGIFVCLFGSVWFFFFFLVSKVKIPYEFIL